MIALYIYIWLTYTFIPFSLEMHVARVDKTWRYNYGHIEGLFPFREKLGWWGLIYTCCYRPYWFSTWMRDVRWTVGKHSKLSQDIWDVFRFEPRLGFVWLPRLLRTLQSVSNFMRLPLLWVWHIGKNSRKGLPRWKLKCSGVMPPRFHQMLHSLGSPAQLKTHCSQILVHRRACRRWMLTPTTVSEGFSALGVHGHNCKKLTHNSCSTKTWVWELTCKTSHKRTSMQNDGSTRALNTLVRSLSTALEDMLPKAGAQFPFETILWLRISGHNQTDIH